MVPMTVRHSKPIAGTILVIGALLLLMSILSEQRTSTFAGAVLTLLGGLMLVNPTLRIERDEVQVRNAIGMTMRRFPVSTPADLRLEGTRLEHVPQDRKIMTLGFGADREDVEALRAQLQPQG